ncbi:MAG: sulfatase, partial [Planctomycetota bacterium]
MRSLDRRTFIKGLTGVSSAAILGPHLVSTALQARMEEPLEKRPNIVVILADDHGYAHSGCYGDPNVKTPHIDGLAGEGMRFTRVFAPSSICTPSRSALFTGCYPHKIGCHKNHGAVYSHIKSLPHYFFALGYEVGLSGVYHVKPQKAFPFQFINGSNLRDFLAGEMGRPYCLVIGLFTPHRPYLEQFQGKSYDPREIVLEPHLVDTPETRQDMAYYYNSVSAADREVGQYMEWLKESGQQENTLLIYTSDHGPCLPFAKWTNYDSGLRVPFVARWPGVIPAGATSEGLVSLVDLLPTLIELAGGSLPEKLDGKSFGALLRGKSQTHRQSVFACHTHTGVLNSQGTEFPIRSIRTSKYKYILNLKPEETFHTFFRPGKENLDACQILWNSWVRNAEEQSFAALQIERVLHH